MKQTVQFALCVLFRAVDRAPGLFFLAGDRVTPEVERTMLQDFSERFLSEPVTYSLALPIPFSS
jgi:hypothetical protein